MSLDHLKQQAKKRYNLELTGIEIAALKAELEAVKKDLGQKVDTLRGDLARADKAAIVQYDLRMKAEARVRELEKALASLEVGLEQIADSPVRPISRAAHSAMSMLGLVRAALSGSPEAGKEGGKS